MSETSTIPVKEILAAANPLIKALVDTFLVPKLEKIKNKLSSNITKRPGAIEGYFSEYFQRSYEKYSILNTLVFSNTEKLLKDIYIPLTIVEILKNEKKPSKSSINGFPYALGKKYKKILITDTAGMGKSTLVKRIFLDVIDKNVGIPIVVELRRLNKEKTILNEINEQLSAINKVFSEPLLLDLLNDGDFIFFFDGYDEIPLMDRDIVTQDMQSFISKTQSNRFIITSRPENALAGFGDFHEFKIEPLKKNEAFTLLKKYDSRGKISRMLINKLKEKEYNNIGEFLTNPLLVSLLFTAFEYKQTIPLKKHIFYRQVYDANFENHDLTKGDSFIRDKHSQLDIDDFHRVLRHLGYSCLREQTIEFSKDELLNLIAKSKEFCIGLKFKESDFLNDIISTVPLFTRDGIYYRWSHKSLQEYFAAQFIYLDAKEIQRIILEKILANPNIEKFQNILDLYYDIDYKMFRNVFIYDLLKEFKTHANAIFQFINIEQQHLINRIELTFPSFKVIFKTDHEEYDPEKGLKMFGHLEKINKLKVTNIHGVISEDSGRLQCVEYVNSKRSSILSILYSKKNQLVTTIQDPIMEPNYFSELESAIPKEYDAIPVNSKSDNILNKPKCFIQVNDLIRLCILDKSIFSYSHSMELLTSIEKEISQESSVSNNLLAGL